jgi:hypothetical protein
MVSSPLPNDWLNSYAYNITSQFGEDGIIAKIFEILPQQDDYFCVEFGAGDGFTLSNTHTLINQKGWYSIQIEANPGLYQELMKRYEEHPRVICAHRLVSFEGENSLDNILTQTPIPQDFDLISIDIDGNDWYIWDSLQIYRPKVVLIEFVPTIPHQVAFVQPKDISVNQGSSLAAFIHLARKKGYELIATTDINAFFVDRKFFPLFNISNNSIWNMYKNQSYCTFVFQLMDGTILLRGNHSLIWRRVIVDSAMNDDILMNQSVELDLDAIQNDIQKMLREKWIPEAQARSQSNDN